MNLNEFSLAINSVYPLNSNMMFCSNEIYSSFKLVETCQRKTFKKIGMINLEQFEGFFKIN